MQFFDDLPSDGLLREEIELLEMLEKMAVIAQALFPQGVGIKEWAEKRVPNEALEFVNASGLLRVSNNRRDAPPYVESRGGARTFQAIVPTESVDPCEKYFENLPSSKLTPQEDELYRSLVSLLRRVGQTSVSAVYERDPRTRAAAEVLLPQVVPLDEWVRRRLKGKVEVFSLDVASPWTRDRTEPWLKLLPGAGFDLEHSIANPRLPNNHNHDGNSPTKTLSSSFREVPRSPVMARTGYVEYNRLKQDTTSKAPIDWRVNKFR